MSTKVIGDTSTRYTPSNWILWGLAVVTWIAVAGMLASKVTGNRPMVWALTVVASTAYLATGLLAGAHQSRFGAFVAAALLCCWLGDLIGPMDFVWGLYAFLAAHLFLMVAFWVADLDWKQSALALPVLVAVAASLMLWILPNVPEDERMDVAAYTVVISAMVVAAWGARRKNPWLLPAAVVFFVSDILVARWRYGGGPINGYLCYPLYYTACVWFAMSIRSAATQGER